MNDLQQLAGRILDCEIRPVECPAEADFHELWQRERINTLDPTIAAATSGAMSDRLAWVFQSGYQSTIRRCFPSHEPGTGWAAFVNSEDPAGELPGTRVDRDAHGFVLNGWKTWVAGAGHVDWLFVSSGHNQSPFVRIPRHAAGVHLETGRATKYLTELAQGRVQFEAVRTGALVGGAESFAIFRTAEGAYARTALSAFMLSQMIRLSGPPALIAEALAVLLGWASLLALEIPSREVSIGTLGAAIQTRALEEQFEYLIRAADPALHQRWMRDRARPQSLPRGIAERAASAFGLRPGALSGIPS